MKRKWPTTNVGWREYYVTRWARNQRASTLRLALFYHFLALMEGEEPADG